MTFMYAVGTSGDKGGDNIIGILENGVQTDDGAGFL